MVSLGKTKIWYFLFPNFNLRGICSGPFSLLVGSFLGSLWKKVLPVCPITIGNSLHLLIPGGVGRTFQAACFSSPQQVWFATADATGDNGQGYIFKAPTDSSWGCVCFTADYELAQLQEKLRETEEAMEKLINRVGPNCDRYVSNYSILKRDSVLIGN